MKKTIEENLKVLVGLPWWAIGRVVDLLDSAKFLELTWPSTQVNGCGAEGAAVLLYLF